MADLTLVTDNYFPTASETFADNLSSSISAGATTVPVNSGIEYATGEIVCLTVDPGTVNEATFHGKKDTTNQFIECVWTEGNTAVGHDAGATIIDYDSATHFNSLSKGIQQTHNQDGTLKTQPVRDALGLGSSAVNGWEVIPYTLQVASGYSQGNGSYEVTVANNDLTDEYSVGQKIRLTRSTTAPTQCLDLELSSSQYASRADGSCTGTIDSVTDDITTEAWIKPESIGAQAGIISKRSTTVSGFTFCIEADGRISLFGYNTSVFEGGTSYQAVALSRWQHVAASIDLSGNSYVIHLNGISITTALTGGSGAIASFTNAGDLCVGSILTGSGYFDGKISDARVWNVVRTTLQIRDNKDQQLVGSETNLIGYWKLNGDLNDSTSSANHLTGSGGAVATTVDNPFNDTQYGVISAISYSAPNTTLMIYTGNSQVIPNQTLSAPYYSTQASPYGFPKDRDKWSVEALFRTNSGAISIASINNWFIATSRAITVPIGSFSLSYNVGFFLASTVSAARDGFLTLASSLPTAGLKYQELTSQLYRDASANAISQMYKEASVSLSSSTIYSLYASIVTASGTETYYIRDDAGGGIIRATPNFL